MCAMPSSRTVSLVGAVALRALATVAKRATVLGLVESAAKLQKIYASRRRVVFYHWTEDEIPRLAVATLGFGFGDDVSFVVDDTVGGQLGGVMLSRCGLETCCLRVSSAALAVRDTRILMRQGTHLSVSADGRGPYRHVNRRLPDLIRAKRAVAVPVSVRVGSVLLELSKPWPIVIPGLHSTIAVAIGDAIELGSRDGHGLLAEGLDGVLSRATALLRCRTS